MKAIICDKIFDGEQIIKNHAVLYDGENIDSIVKVDELPEDIQSETFTSGILAPGFIDIQVNGGGGVLFNDTQTVEAISCIGRGHRSYGTTRFMPTLISDKHDKMLMAHEAAKKAILVGSLGAIGIHYEGPFLNVLKRGAHSSEMVRQIEPNDVKFLLEDFPGIKMVTIAPECVDNAVIKALYEADVRICIGHSAATYDQTVEALKAGASCFTHLFNAMSGFSARSPGVIGAALESRDAWCGMIVDGIHVHPASLKIALASKPQGKCILVTDAMPTVGSDRDEFLFFGELLKADNNKIVNKDGVLSGCHLNMSQAVSNAVRWLDVSVEEALRMGSLYPAEFLGVSNRLGRIRKGYIADLIMLDDKLNVMKSWLAGNDVLSNFKGREP